MAKFGGSRVRDEETAAPKASKLTDFRHPLLRIRAAAPQALPTIPDCDDDNDDGVQPEGIDVSDSHTSEETLAPAVQNARTSPPCVPPENVSKGTVIIEGLPSLISSKPRPARSQLYSSPDITSNVPEQWSLSEKDYNQPQGVGSDSSSATLVPNMLSSSFVPASSVFLARASPLHLPRLDHYLSSLPAAQFTHSGVFPGLEPLQKTSLADYENNDFTPGWRRGIGSTVLASGVTAVMGALGSSIVSTFYNLQEIYQALQLFTVVITSISPSAQQSLSSTRRLLLYTLPNLLALNLSAALGYPLLFLMVFFLLGICLEYIFWRVTRSFVASNGIVPEGGRVESWKEWGNGKKAAMMALSFTITILYLPLSTLALQALLWSSSFWPSPESFDPSQNCYTTSSVAGSINLAWIVVPVAVFALGSITIYHPIRLAQTIRACLPRVDDYTELGRKRTKEQKQLEYQRLVNRDRNPFAFLYNNYRREWGAYQSMYMLAKIIPLLLATLFTTSNCVFLSASQETMGIVRESLIITSMVAFLLLQSFASPFVDPVSNASEWVSRLSYVLTAGIGLIVVLQPNEETIWNGPVLYTLEGVYYCFDVYFTVVDWSWVHRLVKRMTHRVDFSIDVFSPDLDVSSTSIHIKRRIWQETISSLLLTADGFRMPSSQKLVFDETRILDDSNWPPVLVNFQGTVAERHVENLKILRELGVHRIQEAVSRLSDEEAEVLEGLISVITEHFVGPDCHWSAFTTSKAPWGNAWVTPFPFTVIIRFDDSTYSTLSSIEDLQEYVSQNSSQSVRIRRRLRQTLRSLDGMVVRWPYTHTKEVGSRWVKGGYRAQVSTHYETCTIHVTGSGDLPFEGIQLGSGFTVSLTYAKDVVLDGGHIGLTDTFSLTRTLAHFLLLNEDLVADRLPQFSSILKDYTLHIQDELLRKARTLSYEFITLVYEQPYVSPREVRKIIDGHEWNENIGIMITRYHPVWQGAHERMTVVSALPVKCWWYIFWDDFWRRNQSTISQLRLHASDFDPHFSTSLAYQPLPRAVLESFLTQRGLLDSSGRKTTWFNVGLLNKIYFHVNQLVFRGTEDAILVRWSGTSPDLEVQRPLYRPYHEKDPSNLSAVTGTGGGTSHDDSSIRTRPAYTWEAVYSTASRPRSWFEQRLRVVENKMRVWFGLTNLDRAKQTYGDLALGLQFEEGRWRKVRGL